MIRSEMANLIARELKDPRIGFATVTEVAIAPDLRQARVYISVLGNDQQESETIAALVHARSFLRREIGVRCKLRYAPELDFIADRTMARAAHIEDLLRGAAAGGGSSASAAEDEEEDA